ncbi:hypothetical protein KI387_026656 [Taxus chinensis]|uniref:Uncharacterized protein n=1 Tax=Taxus chinensis TaxID=29808 RepID=A0AA38FWA1_TAXCH|nr:hypothetical protein KI387_026656 [Taxus chinensis]
MSTRRTRTGRFSRNGNKQSEKQMGHLGHEDVNRLNRVNRKSLSRGAQGHLGKMDANRPVRLKSAQGAQGKMGRRDARDVDCRRSRKPIKQRHVSSAEYGTRKPISGGSEVYVPNGLGHPGQKDAKGVRELADPSTNQIMTRVTREKIKKSKGKFSSTDPNQ